MITTRHKLTRYGASLAVVLGVHAVAIAIALHWSAPRTVQLPPAAMVIDLAPMPAPPPPAPPKVVTPPQPPAPVEELPLPKLAEAPKPTIQVPKPVKPKPKPQPPKPVEKKDRATQGETFRGSAERCSADQSAGREIGAAGSRPVAAAACSQGLLGRHPAGAFAEVQKVPARRPGPWQGRPEPLALRGRCRRQRAVLRVGGPFRQR